MSEETKLYPKCPFCEAQPLLIRNSEVVFPSHDHVMIIYCANEECGMALAFLPPTRPAKIQLLS